MMDQERDTLTEGQTIHPAGKLPISPSSAGTEMSAFSRISDSSFIPDFAATQEMSVCTSSSSEEVDEDLPPLWIPGDGIVPSIPQFNAVFNGAKQSWSSAAYAGGIGHSNDINASSFIDLFKDVPSLLYGATTSTIKNNSETLETDMMMHIRTTVVPDCEAQERLLKLNQLIGCSQPYQYIKSADATTYFPQHETEIARIFSSIVLAWSYILSCRWVNLLQSLGEAAFMKHEVGANVERGFWDLVTRSRWTAQVEGTVPMYSPWMLRESKRKVENGRQLFIVEPQARLAYDILRDFCFAHGQEELFFTGFASCLLLHNPDSPPTTLASPMKISDAYALKKSRPLAVDDVYQVIDKVMFLSSMFKSGASILASAFFNPSVPCNAIGASSQGIIDAVLPKLKTEGWPVPQLDFNDLTMFLDAISCKSPATHLLWLAATYTGQAGSILSMALTKLPPIHLPTAIMTNLHQTFLQCSDGVENSMTKAVPRKHEMLLSYWTRNEAWVPWSVAPPFGVVPINNISLEIREHLAHNHIPMSWKLYYDAVDTKEVVYGRDISPLVPSRPVQPAVVQVDGTSDMEYACSLRAKEAAERQSAQATSRLYNWHRAVDGGLWLAEADNDSRSKIRDLNNHAWILEMYQDFTIPISGEEIPRLNLERIVKWLDALEVEAAVEEQEIVWLEPTQSVQIQKSAQLWVELGPDQ